METGSCLPRYVSRDVKTCPFQVQPKGIEPGGANVFTSGEFFFFLIFFVIEELAGNSLGDLTLEPVLGYHMLVPKVNSQEELYM